MFVVKGHESLHGEKADAEMLTMRNNVIMEDACINIRTGRFILFEFLNNSVVDNVTGLVDSREIETLRGTENDICQKVNGVKERIVTSLVPRSRTEISGTSLVAEIGSVFCFPRVMTAL
jgi:hypothetical protein